MTASTNHRPPYHEYRSALTGISHPTSAFTLGCVTIVPQPSTCPAEPRTNDPHGPALGRPQPATESASSASHDTDSSRFNNTKARSTSPSSVTPWTKTNSTTTTSTTTPTRSHHDLSHRRHLRHDLSHRRHLRQNLSHQRHLRHDPVPRPPSPPHYYDQGLNHDHSNPTTTN